jgi:hypothetical protein
MPQSYSPVYLPQDWSATSMGANNLVVDVPVDSTSRELTIPACLDPDNAINQGSAASYSQNNLVVSGNSAHATVRTNILTDGSSKYVWEVTVVKHDPNIKIGAMLPDDNVSGSEQLGTNASTGQGWAFISDNGDALYHNTAMSSNTAIVDGDMYHLEFNNDTGDVYVWRKASGGTWTAENSGNSVTSGSGKTALADKKVHLAGHLYQTSGTNLMRFNFSGPFDKAASATYVPFTQTATGVGNHWTLNPLASTDTLTNGNLSFTGASNFSSYVTAPALPLTGKWYWEIRAVGSVPISASANYDTYVGVVKTSVAIPTASHTSDSNLWVWGNPNPASDSGNPAGTKYNGSGTDLLPTSGFGDNSIIMIAVDMDNSKIYFGNDGTWAGSGNPASGSYPAFSNLSGQVMPFQSLYGDSATYNFGARPFIHTPPTGFKALNTANLPAPTVAKPSDHFGTLLWTGNDGGSRLIATGESGVTGTSINFTPDFVWIKRRDSAQSNFIFDSVRTVRRYLHTNSADAEPGANGGLVSFAANGFNIDNTDSFNTASQTRVAWCLEAGTSWSESAQNSNILASSGKKSSTAKFSIATWEHRTSANYAIKHNLGTTPEFFMIKSVDQATNWSNWHTGLSDSANRIVMTDAATEASSYWADSSDSADGSGSYADISSGESPVTSTLFAIQDGEAGAGTFVGYFFARTPGLIGIGSYIGNTTNLPCVVVDDGASGFRPAWIMFKNISSSGYGWSIFDVAREASDGNPNSTALNASGSGGDSSVASYQHDILANGFKIRGTSGETNGNGNTIIYLAFAEHPFGGSGVAQAKTRS